MNSYFGSIPEILEQRPPRAARDDANGLTAARQFSVLAASDVAAIMRLRDAGIRKGAPFQTPWGDVPDPFCLCQSVEAMGRPPAINRGVGQYICVAEYARRQAVPGAVPGGPVRWSRKASLISQPVDIQKDGAPIFSTSMEAPDPPLTALLADEVLHGEFYFAATDELAAAAVFRPFENKINAKDSKKLGCPRGCLLIHPFTTQPTDTGWILMTVDIQYREPRKVKGKLVGQGGNTYELPDGRVEGWADVFINKGRRKLVDSTQSDPSRRYAWIREGPNNTGSVIGEPYLLDEFGNIIGADSNGNVPENFIQFVGDKVVLVVAMNYDHVDFEKIPFPS